MKSPFQRRTAFVAVLLAPALAACGFGAQTDQIYQAAQGVDNRATQVKILNASVVAGENGSGTFTGSFDNGSGETQTLEKVTAEGVTATKNAASISVLPRQLLNLGKPVEGPHEEMLPLLVLTGDPIIIGKFVRLTFTFSGVGDVTVNVLVVSNSPEVGHEFSNVPVPSSAKPSTPAAEPTEGASTEPETGTGTEEPAN